MKILEEMYFPFMVVVTILLPFFGSNESPAFELKIETVGEGFKGMPQPKINRQQGDGKVTSRNDGKNGVWVYDIEFGDSIMTRLNVRVDEEDFDDNYELFDINFDAMSYEKEKSFVIKLISVKPDWSAKIVRRLYATRVTDLDREDLLKFAQESKSAAFHRIEHRKEEDGSQFHDYDVQAVFKFLEVARELKKKTYLSVPRDYTKKARSWLSKAITVSKTRVGHALAGDNIQRGIKNAQQMVKDIKTLEGWRYKQMWDYVIQEKECDRQYPLMVQFKREYFQLSNEESRRISMNIGVFRGSVLSAIAQCMSRLVRCQDGKYSSRNLTQHQIDQEKLNDLIKQIINERVTTKKRRLAKKLISDQNSLKEIRNALQEDRPMICKEVYP